MSTYPGQILSSSLPKVSLSAELINLLILDFIGWKLVASQSLGHQLVNTTNTEHNVKYDITSAQDAQIVLLCYFYIATIV